MTHDCLSSVALALVVSNEVILYDLDNYIPRRAIYSVHDFIATLWMPPYECHLMNATLWMPPYDRMPPYECHLMNAKLATFDIPHIYIYVILLLITTIYVHIYYPSTEHLPPPQVHLPLATATASLATCHRHSFAYHFPPPLLHMPLLPATASLSTYRRHRFTCHLPPPQIHLPLGDVASRQSIIWQKSTMSCLLYFRMVGFQL